MAKLVAAQRAPFISLKNNPRTAAWLQPKPESNMQKTVSVCQYVPTYCLVGSYGGSTSLRFMNLKRQRPLLTCSGEWGTSKLHLLCMALLNVQKQCFDLDTKSHYILDSKLQRFQCQHLSQENPRRQKRGLERAHMFM